MKKAFKIAMRAMDTVRNELKDGKTEREIAAVAERRMWEEGAEDIAFKTKVASGSRAGTLSWLSTNRRIKLGEPVVIDLGCVYHSYCSDFTRTFFIGRPSQNLNEIRESVLKARQRALEAIRPGMKFETIDKVVKASMKLCRYGKYL